MTAMQSNNWRGLLSRLLWALLVALVPVSAAAVILPDAPRVGAESYILMDARTGTVILEKNADLSFPPASLTKIMTGYLVADYVANGQLSLDDQVPISIKAWRTGGSKMFVREGTRVSLGDLIKGLVIQSGNDASIAIAEYVAEDEEAFVALMNRYAGGLGLENTRFANATGLPAPDHYSTARDLAALSRALINTFPEHYATYRQKRFTYNNVSQRNRNRLLWQDKEVDGIKTGHTEEAGYCFIGSAKKGDTRLVSVVLKSPSDEQRFTDSRRLLNYGFRYYATSRVLERGQELEVADIWGSKVDRVRLGISEDLYLTLPRDQIKSVQVEFEYKTYLRAPLVIGQAVGQVRALLDGEVLAERELVALEKADAAGWFGQLGAGLGIFLHSLFLGDG